MRRLDELHLELPFAGARMLRDLLVLEGFRLTPRPAALSYRAMFLGGFPSHVALGKCAVHTCLTEAFLNHSLSDGHFLAGFGKHSMGSESIGVHNIPKGIVILSSGKASTYTEVA
jgi:hypothetical protein